MTIMMMIMPVIIIVPVVFFLMARVSNWLSIQGAVNRYSHYFISM